MISDVLLEAKYKAFKLLKEKQQLNELFPKSWGGSGVPLPNFMGGSGTGLASFYRNRMQSNRSLYDYFTSQGRGTSHMGYGTGQQSTPGSTADISGNIGTQSGGTATSPNKPLEPPQSTSTVPNETQNQTSTSTSSPTTTQNPYSKSASTSPSQHKFGFHGTATSTAPAELSAGQITNRALGGVYEETLLEARVKIIKARIRGGKVQRRKRVSNVPGMTLRGGKLVRMSPTERRKRRMGARKAKIKRRAKLARALQKRKRSLQKRKRLGL